MFSWLPSVPQGVGKGLRGPVQARFVHGSALCEMVGIVAMVVAAFSEGCESGRFVCPQTELA